MDAEESEASRRTEADLLTTGRVASLDGSAALIAGVVSSSAIGKLLVGEIDVGSTLALHKKLPKSLVADDKTLHEVMPKSSEASLQAHEAL